MKRDEVLRRIERVGVMPVVRAPSAEIGRRASEAVVAGGIGVLEVTLTVPGALALIADLAARLAGRAVVGAGTVVSADEARACIDAGAAFIVSPGLDVPTVEAARERGVAAIPGALTPTEVMAAMKAGADMIKIFPCSSVGGAKHLKALRGPFPTIKLVPTGGVGVANVHEYFAAGASAVGVGSELVDAAELARSGEAALTERARELSAAVARSFGALGRG